MPSDLSSLSTPPDPNQMSMSRPPATINANSQLPGTRLPFIPGGWKADELAEKLGQYDRIPGTDSDAYRCVETVALMSHILMGPGAVVSYLNAITLQGMLSAGTPGSTRKRTAQAVISYVISRVRSRQATYGDMDWAIEAVHDLFYGDAAGTPRSDLRGQITPMADFSQQMAPLDIWCDDKAALLREAARLRPGEQLMINTWRIDFNTPPLTPGDTPVSRHPSRESSAPHIDASHKPPFSKYNPRRDYMYGHQMMIFRDATDGHIKLYEPEITVTGKHLFDLTADPSVVDSMLFSDQPASEQYDYVQVLGRMSPGLISFP
jgi:hypothetical protein